MRGIVRAAWWGGLAGLALFLVACSSVHYRSGGGTEVVVGQTSAGGPPPHAPAHGYRRKHQYRYYRDVYVYHDTRRGVYFWMKGSNWEVGAKLPDEISISKSKYVSIEMETDTPYIEFDSHKVKYPPGQAKKEGKGKGKKK